MCTGQSFIRTTILHFFFTYMESWDKVLCYSKDHAVDLLNFYERIKETVDRNFFLQG